MGYELNYCKICGIQLAPDDFDGICSGCDDQLEPLAPPGIEGILPLRE